MDKLLMQNPRRDIYKNMLFGSQRNPAVQCRDIEAFYVDTQKSNTRMSIVPSSTAPYSILLPCREQVERDVRRLCAPRWVFSSCNTSCCYWGCCDWFCPSSESRYALALSKRRQIGNAPVKAYHRRASAERLGRKTK